MLVCLQCNSLHLIFLFFSHLYLPVGQNERLFENLTLEGSLRRYENDKRFRHIFIFKWVVGFSLIVVMFDLFRDQLVKISKDLRISQRPLIEAVGTATEMSRLIRYLAPSLSPPVYGPLSRLMRPGLATFSLSMSSWMSWRWISL